MSTPVFTAFPRWRGTEIAGIRGHLPTDAPVESPRALGPAQRRRAWSRRCGAIGAMVRRE
jgi:hypothetical protein